MAVEIGILLPNNQRQHRTLHIQKDVLPYALCQLLWPVSAALASMAPTDNTEARGMFREAVGGGVRIHPENARMSGRHGVQYVAQCVACAALTPVVWQ